VELFVQDAAARRHPLDVAGADNAALAGRVAMLDLAVVDNGHGLEAAVRVLADAATFVGRLEVMRTGVVEQQEGANLLADAVIGKQRANREAVADPMAAIIAVTSKNLLHGVSPWRPGLADRVGGLMTVERRPQKIAKSPRCVLLIGR